MDIKLINKNKGMYIECLVNNTIEFINNNKIGIFEKRYLPIMITSINKNNVIGKLLSKSTVDFVGNYNGRHIEFETKQTYNEYFSFNIFKKHQINYLINSWQLKCFSFVIIHFCRFEKTFALTTEELIDLMRIKNKNRIPISIFEEKYYKLDVVFPGILEINKFIDNKIKHIMC